MIFGKKKEEVNPYYNSTENAQGNQGAAPAQNPAPQADNSSQAPFPTPILPVPEPLSPATPSIKPEWESKPVPPVGGVASTTAFIRLSDYKQILEDIKALEKQISGSKEELGKLGSILDQERTTLSNYVQLVNDLEKVINDIHASLSNIQA